MDKKYTIEPLDTQKHDRAAFSCGVAPLDTYLKQQANQEAKRNIAVTYILCEQNSTSIVGYYTLSTASIETTQLPEEIRRRLPRYEALPTMLIGRLAVDQQYGGQGFGGHLLVDALRRCFELSKNIGAMAVLVDAKDERAATFYERYGFRRFQDQPSRLYIPMAQIQQLMEGEASS
jgi:predicted GNAT family N-acyltransferase